MLAACVKRQPRLTTVTNMPAERAPPIKTRRSPATAARTQLTTQPANGPWWQAGPAPGAADPAFTPTARQYSQPPGQPIPPAHPPGQLPRRPPAPANGLIPEHAPTGGRSGLDEPGGGRWPPERQMVRSAVT